MTNEITPTGNLYAAVAKLIKAKGRFHTEQNYAELVRVFDATETPAALDIEAERALFRQWWGASKYMQVVISSVATEQAAFDGWQAARRAPVEPARVCKCSMSIRVLGDGCDVCNPELAAQILEENRLDALADLRKAVADGADDEWVLGFVRQYPFNVPAVAPGDSVAAIAKWAAHQEPIDSDRSHGYEDARGWVRMLLGATSADATHRPSVTGHKQASMEGAQVQAQGGDAGDGELDKSAQCGQILSNLLSNCGDAGDGLDDTDRIDYIVAQSVAGSEYKGITSLNVIIHKDDLLVGGARYAIDCMIERAAAATKGVSDD